MDSVLSTIGAVSLSYFAFNVLLSILKGIRAFVLPAVRADTDLKKRYGTWAVVTGATDGIGKAYATELARQGINIVLISRSEDKLHATAEEIESQFGVSTEIHVVDFTGGVEIYKGVEEKLRNIDIGVLVNNVGMAQIPRSFVDRDKDECWKLLNVNCLSVLMMTRIILPGMISRRKGAVINLCSSTGEFPTRSLQIYSGTKAFVNFFTSCLRTECSGTGVDVQCLLPYMVATKMTNILRSPWRSTIMFPEPSVYVRQALRTVGVCPKTHGYWPHALQAYIIGCLPTWLVERHLLSIITLTFFRSHAE